MARSKQPDQAGDAEGAFGKQKPAGQDDPATVSGSTPGSTPAPGKSKSADPDDRNE